MVDSNPPANLHSTLSYDATHAYLHLILNFVPPGGGLSGNQNGVGNAIVNFFNTNGGISLAYSRLTPAGLTQASGETATGSQQSTFNAMNLFMGVMTDPFIARRDEAANAPGAAPGFADEEALAYAAKKRNPNDALAAIYSKAPPVAPFQQRWSVWAAGYGGSQTTDGKIAGRTTPAAACMAPLSAPTIASRATRWSGLHSAGGGTSFSVVNGGSGRWTVPAGAFVATVGAAICPARWPMAGRMSRRIAPSLSPASRARSSTPTRSGRGEGGYRFRRCGPVARSHALCRCAFNV